MVHKNRATDSLVRAGAVITYCVRYKQTKGTHKAKCNSARIHLWVEFPGISKETAAEIERIAQRALSQTITEW